MPPRSASEAALRLAARAQGQAATAERGITTLAIRHGGLDDGCLNWFGRDLQAARAAVGILVLIETTCFNSDSATDEKIGRDVGPSGSYLTSPI